jgi:hypothetical protein
MILEQLDGPPPPELGQALGEFEERFLYPLGPGRSFRIDHGTDYPRFFRAIGKAACFVARRQQVLATLGMAIRGLILPDGSERSVAYLGDLKILPEARGGLVLRRLAQAAEAWARPQVESAFGVVMDGTRVIPSVYTGRLGIPAFDSLGQVLVLRIPTSSAVLTIAEEDFSTDDRAGEQSYRRLSSGRFASVGGAPRERSRTVPQWLVHPKGLACGQLEDTARAKRLIADDGAEMHSAHLSFFACADLSAGAELIRAALQRAHALGFPALFVSVPHHEGPAVQQALDMPGTVAAPATIFGTNLLSGFAWNINTAEI